MADSSIFTTVEAAKAEVEKLKSDPKMTKPRFVYSVVVAGKDPFYVVAQNVGYGRARAAKFLEDMIEVKPVDSAQRGYRPKSIEEQVALMSPEQLDKAKAIIAAMEAAKKPAEPIVEPVADPTVAGPNPWDGKTRKQIDKMYKDGKLTDEQYTLATQE